MNRYLKYFLFSLAGLVLASALLLVVLSLAVNPNDYKPQIVQLVKEKKQRTLTLAGDIKLAFFPKLGFDLGRASLSEYRGEKEFAAVESARLYLSWWPLLKKELVVDQVRIEGVRANLVRFKDGTSNFDDLLKKEEEDKQLKFDIDSVTIARSAFTFRDEMAGRQFSISELNLKTGRLASGMPTDAVLDCKLQGDRPRVKLQVHMATGLTFDTEAKRYAVKGMNLELQGDAEGVTNLGVGIKGDVVLDQGANALLAENLAIAVAGKKGADDIDVRIVAPKMRWAEEKLLTEKIDLVAKIQQGKDGAKGEMGLVANIPSMTGDSQSFKAGILNIDVSATQPGGTYKGKLSSPLAGSFKEKLFELSDVKGNLDGKSATLPGGGMKFDIAGNVQLDLQRQGVKMGLTSHLDESNIRLKAAIIPFSSPHIALDLDIDQIDVDRYLPAKAPQSQHQPEKPFDFSILKTLNASGNVRVGKLKLYNIKASDVRLEFKAGAGRLDISPLAAALYEGKMNGNVSVSAAGPSIATRQHISAVNVSPLLKDALNKDVLEGRGSVDLDVRAQGATQSAMKKGLQGKAGLNLRDGAVKGVNVAATLREAKAKLGVLKGEKVQTANTQEKTDFTELSATFDIQQGVAHNEDLAAKSPLLRLAGSGDIDIGGEVLNYLARVTVAGTLEGQGGRDLASLKGVTVPLRITGPFAAPKIKLEFGSMVSESVKQEVKTRAVDKLQEGLKGLFR